MEAKLDTTAFGVQFAAAPDNPQNATSFDRPVISEGRSEKIMGTYSGLSKEPVFNLSPFRAALVLAILIVSILYGLAVCRPIPNLQGNQANGEDLKCYQAIVAKIQAGGSYYSAAGYELRRMGYATASIFNWRLPLLAWFLGRLPSLKTGQAIVFLLAAGTLFLWLKVFQHSKYTSAQIVFGGLLLTGPLIYSVIPGPFLMHEFWAGTLIALSLALYAHGWGCTSLLPGLAALFLRELALPFVIVMTILALIEGKRREALLWLVGITIFGMELFIHWSIVSKLITESDKAMNGGWIAFGGWPFVLNAAQMHPFLILAPAWLAAIVLPISLLGLIGQRTPGGIRIACTVGVYILAYAIVGRSFNTYWGLMFAFIMPIGLLQAIGVLKGLFKQSRNIFRTEI